MIQWSSTTHDGPRETTARLHAPPLPRICPSGVRKGELGDEVTQDVRGAHGGRNGTSESSPLTASDLACCSNHEAAVLHHEPRRQSRLAERAVRKSRHLRGARRARPRKAVSVGEATQAGAGVAVRPQAAPTRRAPHDLDEIDAVEPEQAPSEKQVPIPASQKAQQSRAVASVPRLQRPLDLPLQVVDGDARTSVAALENLELQDTACRRVKCIVAATVDRHPGQDETAFGTQDWGHLCVGECHKSRNLDCKRTQSSAAPSPKIPRGFFPTPLYGVFHRIFTESPLQHNLAK